MRHLNQSSWIWEPNIYISWCYAVLPLFMVYIARRIRLQFYFLDHPCISCTIHFDYITWHRLVMNEYLKSVIKALHVGNVMCTVVAVDEWVWERGCVYIVNINRYTHLRIHCSWAVFVIDVIIVYFLALFTFPYHFLPLYYHFSTCCTCYLRYTHLR